MKGPSGRVQITGTILTLAALLLGCSASQPVSPPTREKPSASAPGSVPATTSANGATPSPTSRPGLVGRWQLDKTCQLIVTSLTNVGHPELIRQDVGEVVEGNVDGVVPAGWDPKHPCAKPLPPTPHSHTFWPDGSFNSYDDHDNQVDDGPWAIVDGTTFSIGTW